MSSPSTPTPSAPSSDSALVDDLVDLSSRAVQFDQTGEYVAAIYYYEEAAKLLEQIQEVAKAEQYRKRAAALDEELAKREAAKPKLAKAATVEESDLERAYFLLSEGLDADEEGNLEEALLVYSEAVELCLKAKKSTSDPVLQKKLTSLATQALERGEKIKGIDVAKNSSKKQLNARVSPGTAKKLLPPIDGLNLRELPSAQPGASSAPSGGGYTEEEKRVLAATSMINRREYVPFLSVDLRERFAYPVPFSDKDGKLSLSPKQREKLAKWARPEEFLSAPTVLQAVDCFSVKQTIVSDCSFIASIAIRHDSPILLSS
jgi:calpain-7